MCFTDKTDAFTSSIGYLPGPMPWKVQEALEAKGVEVLNKSETGAVTVDRELITGAAPTRPTTSASWRPRLPGAPLPLAYLAIRAALPRYLPPKTFSVGGEPGERPLRAVRIQCPSHARASRREAGAIRPGTVGR